MLTIDVEKLATYQLGMEKGMERGTHDRDVAIAKNLLDRGMESDLVASMTGLSAREVESLRGGQPKPMEN